MNVFAYKGSIDRYMDFHTFCQISVDLKNQSERLLNGFTAGIGMTCPSPEILGVHLLSRSVPIIVANNKEFEALKSAGYKNIIIGGLPSAYIKKQHSSKK